MDLTTRHETGNEKRGGGGLCLSHTADEGEDLKDAGDEGDVGLQGVVLAEAFVDAAVGAYEAWRPRRVVCATQRLLDEV